MTADSGPPVFYGTVELRRNPEVEKAKEKSKVATKSAWKLYVWIIPLVHTEIWISALQGITQTFFPLLASERGVAGYKCGLVFSSFKAAMFLASVLGDRMLQWTSPQTCYLIGQGGVFLFSVSFGSLYWTSGGELLFFISLAMVLLGGFTIGLYFVSLFSVVTHQFRKSPGLIIVWAYPLPFFVMSSILMISFPFNAKLGRVINPVPAPLDAEADVTKPTYFRLLADLLFLAHMIALTTVWVVSGFNEPTLQPSLEEFGTSVTIRGTVFAVQYASYVVGCILAATFCHFQVVAFYAFVGHLLTLTAYLIIGPIQLIPLKRNLALVYASQVLIGLGTSSLFVCPYQQALQRARQLGYPDDIHTHGFVSSTVFTFLVSGSTVLPSTAPSSQLQ